MRSVIFAEIAPRSAIEWLLAIDVVELSWEIQRYRLLRHKLLDHYRQAAIEHSLRHVDLAGLPPELEEAATCHIRQNAQAWRTDRRSATEIEARLATYGYDPAAINAEVYLQAREVFLVFEALLNTAQNRRLSLLREIDNRRHAKYPLRGRRDLLTSALAPSPGPQPTRYSEVFLGDTATATCDGG
ncbi:hypothetical protein [Bradyrhizobium sp. Leo121]|uniref:hypothetical protein n=1 Tax=Bradyrhizobium sp. Leo121 TaxID=1571195 RepID=UPI001FDFFB8B|nr:hypothetical protein [Bradyrhizobium sp. Leo121]